jgi:hypothetical protein
VSGTAATVTGAAQTNITSVGTLTALTVDNLNVNGNTITATSGAVNITPASGSAIVLDETINVDAGVVTGATSITSTAFVGNVTGNVSGTAATVTGAAQTNVTSLGTLTALTVDDVAIDGKVITMTDSPSDTATFTVGAHGALTIATTDTNAAAANIQITADGTAELAGTTVTLNSAGGITLDADNGTITFADGGSSLGTITSSGYTGNVVGNVSGTAATVTGAAQTNITSLGTLTALTIDDVAIDGKVITMTDSSSDTATFTVGTNGALTIATTDAAAEAANIQINADGTAELAGTTVTLNSSGGITFDADNGVITFTDGGVITPLSSSNVIPPEEFNVTVVPANSAVPSAFICILAASAAASVVAIVNAPFVPTVKVAVSDDESVIVITLPSIATSSIVNAVRVPNEVIFVCAAPVTVAAVPETLPTTFPV